MKLIKILQNFLLFFAFFLGGIPFIVEAQSQSLSVTPPLFQLSVKPGDIWQSSVRVINPNEFEMTVYAEVVNFAPEGEGGLGKFMPVVGTDEVRATLAEWIEINKGPYVIPPGKSEEVSFFVEIPRDASPGGHFAAILISTEPPKSEGGELALVTTQTVASLFFTRIEGDILEKADIREFTVLDRSIELPEAEFSLRFENKGNVHVQPRGSISITNMWGTERGVIPINHDTHFGNVLPQTIRDFRFSWKGERSLADIGRYNALVSLAYGDDGVKSVSMTTSFWVIPVKGGLITLVCVLGFFATLTWMIRLYIRRMLILAGVDPDVKKEKITKESSEDSLISKYRKVAAPLQEGTLNLRTRLHNAHESKERFASIFAFILQYKKFFIALLALGIGIVGLFLYIGKVSDTDTDYEITIDQGDSTTTFTKEEIENGKGR